MSSLDEKLREVLPEFDRGYWPEILAEIKQAFADEGYVKPLFKNVSKFELESDPKYNSSIEEEK